MVLPGGPDASSVSLAIAFDDLRQLAHHDAGSLTVPGAAGPLAALDTGGAPALGTVLMVPGYTGSKEDFAPLLRPLAAAGYRVVALDQRGQHESSGPADPAEYSVEILGADVAAVAEALRGQDSEPLHLVGHSFGGLVARAAVIARPDLFRSLTLLGSGPGGLTGRRAELLDHLAPLLDEGGVRRVHEMLELVAAADPKALAIPAATRAFLSKIFLLHDEPALRGMADAMLAEPDRVAELRATGVPVLVAHGEADDAWLPHVQADMAERLGARHEVITSSIHSPAVENPPRTLEVLCDFWMSVRS